LKDIGASASKKGGLVKLPSKRKREGLATISKEAATTGIGPCLPLAKKRGRPRKDQSSVVNAVEGRIDGPEKDQQPVCMEAAGKQPVEQVLQQGDPASEDYPAEVVGTPVVPTTVFPAFKPSSYLG
jgi:hypothetical protein